MTMTSQRRIAGRPTFFGGFVVLLVVAVMLAVAGYVIGESNLYLWSGILAVVALVLLALGRRPHQKSPKKEDKP